MLIGKGFLDRVLTESEIRDTLAEGFYQADLAGMKVLTIIPDGTRSGPTDMFFRLVCELLVGQVRSLDFLIALGTHQPMPQAAIQKMLGISAAEMKERYSGVRIFNHYWNNPDNLRTFGVIPASEIEELRRLPKTNSCFSR
jgi:nickel-dependent lactate racemase